MRSLLRGRTDAPAAPAPQAERVAPEVFAVGLKALAGAAAMQIPGAAPELSGTGLTSRAVRFDEVSTGWYSYWAAALDSAPRPHRKLWEFAAVLQAMFDRGLLLPGARALGVAVGSEPMSSCLANLGLTVTATDLPDALDAESVRRPNLVTPETFGSHVRLQPWDVLTPGDTGDRDYDMMWSCGLLNQLGDTERMELAVKHGLARLRPGGWAFHTFDLAVDADGEAAGVLTRSAVSRLARAEGAALSFDLGDHPLDGYIDPPPFDLSGPFATPALFSDRGGAPHLKALICGRAVTSYLLILQA